MKKDERPRKKDEKEQYTLRLTESSRMMVGGRDKREKRVTVSIRTHRNIDVTDFDGLFLDHLCDVRDQTAQRLLLEQDFRIPICLRLLKDKNDLA